MMLHASVMVWLCLVFVDKGLFWGVRDEEKCRDLSLVPTPHWPLAPGLVADHYPHVAVLLVTGLNRQ